MIGAVGRVGAVGGSRGRAAVAPAGPDFTLSNSTVTTDWGRAVVGELVPSGVDPGSVYFVLVGDPAGIAVENG